MKANVKRIQIDLNAEDVSDLKALAASRGHLLKPFIEYLIKVQIGALQEVQPVKAQPSPLREPSAEEARARQASKAIEQRQEMEAAEKEYRASILAREYREAMAREYLDKAKYIQWKKQPQEVIAQETPKRESKAVTFLKWLKVL